MSRLVAVVVAGVLLSACAHRPPAPPTDLLTADTLRAEAMIAADAARLDALLDDTLTYVHSNGRIDSKRSLVDALASGRVVYRTIDPGAATVRVTGDTGIVTAPVAMEVAADGRVHHLRSVYTAVYRWQDGRWRLVAYRSSPVP